ncbi:hypothetical protein FOMG_19028 [Fusarium oxysporum f. sp. melonis 26406]|uniref:Zn(2)-C6 fungal-type domain-containing protein n=1 Tax=Fusarium oxysporum f. sp. melonis 26406 TaxID=1089452 RepID=W9YXE8_FUSOX|nr:hypothetical protein FOMG_19028 [Fusarium oxysporum f. sp. melonis 26406]
MRSGSLPAPPAEEPKLTFWQNSTSASIKPIQAVRRNSKQACSSAATIHQHRHRATHTTGMDGRNKRVQKACEQCRMTKSKCDIGFPCRRCKDHGLICTGGVPKKSKYKQLPKGCVEVLENTQSVLVMAIRKLYFKVRNNQSWDLGEPELDHYGQPNQNQRQTPSQTSSPQQHFDFQQHNMSQQPSPSPQQSHVANPQDVLVEARKNLQLTAAMASLNPNLGAMTAMQTIPSQPQHQNPYTQQPLNPSHSTNTASLASPPPMRCPPPPLVASNVLSVQTVTTAPTSVSSTATTPSAEIKHEVISEDVNSMFLPPQAAFSHLPRISVSSTSSGSSGHASIWSTNSGQSSMWQSASTCNRSQAPLPIPPSSSMNGLDPMSAPVGTAGKTNIYWCTSCETSFKRKYDWKRHEDEFHKRWRKYPCPESGCSRSFWGSHSFSQHHKQCHGCKTCPHAEKVVKFLRKRKYWACGFCSALHLAHERHVEHVARHFESGMTKGDWMHSRVVYAQIQWTATSVQLAPKQDWPCPRRPGQLQDLLEFFSGDKGEAQWIVSVAYELADIVLTSAPIPSPQYSHASLGPQGFTHDPRMPFMPLPTQGHAGHQPLMPSPDTEQTNQQHNGAPTDWGMMQYFSDPRVTS